ncbi:MAG TPA: hypothetical protein VEL28_06860 [Candidatus Binatia bacterium]|nr:hypothetical protein [Candidatus Binatia bacterium]
MIERVEDILTLPGFVLSQELPLEGARPPLPGGLWPARILYGGPCGGTYVLTNPSFYNEVLGIVVDENGAISCQKPVVQIRGSKTGRTFATKLAVGSTVFTPKTYFAGETPDSLRWQLLYSGRAGNEIVLDYREFTEMGYGSTARPAFYQQVKYDLSTGRTITFKETQIEVLDATNSMISFRVLRDEKKARRVPDLWEAPTDGALAR